jgi:hypothetical protein
MACYGFGHTKTFIIITLEERTMDASQLIALRRQRELFAAGQLAANVPYGQVLRAGSGATSGTSEIMGGAIQFFSRGRAIDSIGAGPTPPVSNAIIPGVATAKPVVAQPKPQDPRDVALGLFEDLLTWIQTNGKGPTVAARLIYIWAATAAAAWSAIQSDRSKLLQGVHDGWDWDWQQSGIVDAGAWLCQTLAPAMAEFLPGYSSPLAAQAMPTDWQNRWQQWFAAKVADGSASLQDPTIADLSNINLAIGATGLPSGIVAGQWTPVLVNNKKQKYLTFNWGSVASTCLSGPDETAIMNAAAIAYPGSLVRRDEVQEVITMCENLTDDQKMLAEFWAGGPGTATPPGGLAWFWAEVCRQTKPDERTLFLSGLDLGIHLFEGSRITWALKAKYIEARPIQEIRARFASTQMKKWDGSTITGNEWTPYQEANFITPPFADFPSGHSHFSAAFAAVMKQWFGNTVSAMPKKRIDLIAPVAAVANDKVVARIGSSRIQAGIVPASEITFSWNTWDDVATSAGMSRLYGGIHCISAHSGSQRAASEAHSRIENSWQFSV